MKKKPKHHCPYVLVSVAYQEWVQRCLSICVGSAKQMERYASFYWYWYW